MITVLQTLAIVAGSMITALLLLAIGAVMAAWLIGRGMAATGGDTVLGSGRGEAFNIADGSELQAFPGAASADEKHIKSMAAELLSSFGGRPM